MNTDVYAVIAGPSPGQLDPQRSWVPWLIIFGLLALLALIIGVGRRTKPARRGASALGASVAGLDAMLRPSRRHIHEAKNTQRKRDEREGGPDEAGDGV